MSGAMQTTARIDLTPQIYEKELRTAFGPLRTQAKTITGK